VLGASNIRFYARDVAEILADDDSEMSEIDTDSEQEDVLSGEDEYIPNSGDESDNQAVIIVMLICRQMALVTMMKQTTCQWRKTLLHVAVLVGAGEGPVGVPELLEIRELEIDRTMYGSLLVEGLLWRILRVMMGLPPWLWIT
jgi:hypothetical protein